jgi:hypothetical protein
LLSFAVMHTIVVSVCTNESCRRIALARCGPHGSYFRLNRDPLGPTPPSDARCASGGCEVRYTGTTTTCACSCVQRNGRVVFFVFMQLPDDVLCAQCTAPAAWRLYAVSTAEVEYLRRGFPEDQAELPHTILRCVV